jgi:hypothetical protein
MLREKDIFETSYARKVYDNEAVLSYMKNHGYGFYTASMGIVNDYWIRKCDSTGYHKNILISKSNSKHYSLVDNVDKNKFYFNFWIPIQDNEKLRNFDILTTDDAKADAMSDFIDLIKEKLSEYYKATDMDCFKWITNDYDYVVTVFFNSSMVEEALEKDTQEQIWNDRLNRVLENLYSPNIYKFLYATS